MFGGACGISVSSLSSFAGQSPYEHHAYVPETKSIVFQLSNAVFSACFEHLERFLWCFEDMKKMTKNWSFSAFLVSSAKRPFGACFYQSMRLCRLRCQYRCGNGTQDFFYDAYSSKTGSVQSMTVGNLVVAEKRQSEPKWPFWLRVSAKKNL